MFGVGDLQWLAGLLEGEGSFMKGPPSNHGKVLISVEMTDRDVVERVAELFGTSVYVPAKRGCYKQTYIAKLKGDKAASLMQKLLPFMGKRRSLQITECLKSHVPSRRRIVTDDDLDTMYRGECEGKTHAEIAKELGFCRETVTRCLNGG